MIFLKRNLTFPATDFCSLRQAFGSARPSKCINTKENLEVSGLLSLARNSKTGLVPNLSSCTDFMLWSVTALPLRFIYTQLNEGAISITDLYDWL